MRGLSTHPKELTREAVEEWLDNSIKKVRRNTNRNDLDRLILSVERMDFQNVDLAGWTDCIFENGKVEVSSVGSKDTEKLEATSLQKMILSVNSTLEGKKISRSEIKEEYASWILDRDLQEKKISAGGEAIVLKQTFEDLEVVARIQAFDSALFVEREKLNFRINLSEDYEIATDRQNDAPVIPFHENVIKNFCNVEIFAWHDKNQDECLGWITLMEKCDSDLRCRLKKDDLTIEERKDIYIGVTKGLDYLQTIGIEHYDIKPENVLLKNGVAKIIDFGVIMETTNRQSYRQMGYSRAGSKFQQSSYLYAGSAAFTGTRQLLSLPISDIVNKNILPLIICDWRTAWSLMFKPLETEDEREHIKEKLKAFNADWLSKSSSSIEQTIGQIQSLSNTISLYDVRDFCLDDPNLTKSSSMANLKQRLTKQINSDFKNLTVNVLNQKESNLSVPIAITMLIRWAIKNDLNNGMETHKYTVEEIFTILTMIIYPRSLAGLSLNPKNREQAFQGNEVEVLLKRLKYETFLNSSGWQIITEFSGDLYGTFDYGQVLLHHHFIFSRPLTVTGAYMLIDGSVMFHQMVLDRIENSEFILQNTLVDHSGTQIRIPLDREFYVTYEMMDSCKKYFGDFVYYVDRERDEKLSLVNERFNMEEERWYILPQAYSITLTPTACKMDH